MGRARILLEGQTEETFVGQVVAPHLKTLGVETDTAIVVTRQIPAYTYRGGVSSWAQIERDLKLLIASAGGEPVTTMIDYYALPTDVPGMSTRPAGTADVRVRHVEAAINGQFPLGALRSYLSLHEIEALLFSDPAVCGAYLGDSNVTTAMQAAVAACGAPELVNEGTSTAPSKRVLAAYPGFRKRSEGPAILGRIGLAAIRASCPHFDEWITWLEGL